MQKGHSMSPPAKSRLKQRDNTATVQATSARRGSITSFCASPRPIRAQGTNPALNDHNQGVPYPPQNGRGRSLDTNPIRCLLPNPLYSQQQVTVRELEVPVKRRLEADLSRSLLNGSFDRGSNPLGGILISDRVRRRACR